MNCLTWWALVLSLVIINMPWQKQIAEAVNRARNRGYFKFILGGHGPSSAPEFFMQKLGADAVVIGEGEFILPRIGHYLSIGETIIKDKSGKRP